MNTKIYTIWFMLLVLLVSCTKDPVENEFKPDENTEFQIPEEYEEGWVRVKFTELEQDLNTTLTRNGTVQTGIHELDEVAALLGATQIERVFNEGGKFKERRRKYGLHLWYDFYVGEDQPITRAMSSFSSLSCIDIVELIPVERQTSSAKDKFQSFLYGAANLDSNFSVISRGDYSGNGSTFNDPLLSRQWHYKNDGSVKGSIAGSDVNLFPAWEITTGHPDVIVAVIDGGIAYDHPDLAQNMWINTGEIAGNGQDDDNNGYVDDIYGFVFGKAGLYEDTGEIFPLNHGTHCAGTIAAVNNNGVGLCGVAGGNGSPSTGIRLMSCQTYVPDPEYLTSDPHGNTKSTSRTADAYVYAADNGAVIASCSYSYGGTTLSEAYKTGIDYFVDNAGTDENGNQTGPMKGGLLVASASNNSTNETKYPAAYERCISVASIGPAFTKVGHSNYSPTVNITAPGGYNSNSTHEYKGGVLSTIPMESIGKNNLNVGTGYMYENGTSMAVPHVSGIAALVLSAAVENNIPMTVEKLFEILEASCRDIIYKYNPEYVGLLGKGLIDAHLALKILLGYDDPAPKPLNTAVSPSTTTVNLSWTVPEDAYGDPVSTFEIFLSESSLTGIDLSGTLPEGVTKEVINNDKAVGATQNKSFLRLTPETEYYTAIVSVDRLNKRSEVTYLSTKTLKEENPEPNPDPDPTPSYEGSFTLYPSPVKTNLYLQPSEEIIGQKVEVSIFNASGVRVFNATTTCSESPIKINVAKMAGGAYTVLMKFNGKEEKQSILKY